METFCILGCRPGGRNSDFGLFPVNSLTACRFFDKIVGLNVCFIGLFDFSDNDTEQIDCSRRARA